LQNIFFLSEEELTLSEVIFAYALSVCYGWLIIAVWDDPFTALKPTCNPLVCTGLNKGAEFSLTPFHRSTDLFITIHDILSDYHFFGNPTQIKFSHAKGYINLS